MMKLLPVSALVLGACTLPFLRAGSVDAETAALAAALAHMRSELPGSAVEPVAVDTTAMRLMGSAPAVGDRISAARLVGMPMVAAQSVRRCVTEGGAATEDCHLEGISTVLSASDLEVQGDTATVTLEMFSEIVLDSGESRVFARGIEVRVARTGDGTWRVTGTLDLWVT